MPRNEQNTKEEAMITEQTSKAAAVDKAGMVEVRWHGRGGQGAKTASYLLAEAAAEEGKYVQAYPEYGAERSGAPIRSFTRISGKPIRTHSGVTNPSIVVVLDETLLLSVDVCEGVGAGGVILVNSEDSPAELRKRLDAKDISVYTVPATRIAMETLKRPIPNTPMMGALVRVMGTLEIDKVKEGVRKRFSARFRPEIVEANVNAMQRAFEEVRGE
jgi:pyruvate ferredoxin oxidoreductase gamma subunit